MSHNQIGTVNGDGTFNPYGSTVGDTVSADNMTYDNTSSGLNATKVQGAIDEVNSKLVGVTKWQTYTGTTNANGNLIIGGSGSYNIISARVVNREAYAFVRGDGDYVSIKDSNFQPISNTEVTIKYIYSPS